MRFLVIIRIDTENKIYVVSCGVFFAVNYLKLLAVVWGKYGYDAGILPSCEPI